MNLKKCELYTNLSQVFDYRLGAAAYLQAPSSITCICQRGRVRRRRLLLLLTRPVHGTRQRTTVLVSARVRVRMPMSAAQGLATSAHNKEMFL